MTGTEAISNGVPAFKAPESQNARTTLVWMGVLLGTMFFGMNFVATQMGILPASDETVLSQLGRVVLGDGSVLYVVLQIATALILVLAANTSFADFPRLSSILARDRFLPRIFQFRGDRLAFTSGIVTLALFAIALLVIFNGSVDQLIPLYAVGVFASFTLSQSGMVVHWRRAAGERLAAVGGDQRHWRGDDRGGDAGHCIHQVRRGCVAGHLAHPTVDQRFLGDSRHYRRWTARATPRRRCCPRRL